MEPFNAIAAILSLTALFAFVNARFVRLPMSISLMFMSLALSLGLIALNHYGFPVSEFAETHIRDVDFSAALLQVMLGFLLFAGALHVNLDDLKDNWLEIMVFASLGVFMSTILVGFSIFWLSGLFGFGLRLIDCLLFGALISPTDPIAVLAILKKAGAAKSLETKIAGESLFNDGIGVVVFLLFFEMAGSGEELTVSHTIALFAKEALGGAAFGLAAGYVAYRMIKGLNNYQVEVMITLALVVGGYRLAAAMHLSAPIAMVVAGLLIGNHGRTLAMSDITREHLDTFWELVDEILNAFLFVLIGLEVLVLVLDIRYLLAGMLAVPVTLLARLFSIGLPVRIMGHWRLFAPKAIRIMTWAGLRGGISVALALSLPDGPARELILTMTYVVVVFSIIVQGLTIRRLVGSVK